MAAHGVELRSVLPRPFLPPIWRELHTAMAMATIRTAAPAAPVDGGGLPVLLVPGLFRGDGSLRPLARFLRTAGFEPWMAGIDRNLDCSEALVGRLVQRLETIAAGGEHRIAVVGHSRGGLLARVVAHRRPDLVSGVVTLGSPHRDPLAVHPVLWAALMTLAALDRAGVGGVLGFSCAVGACCASFRSDLLAPLPAGVGALSVYSRQDGLVDWRRCADPRDHRLEVATTHTGMPLDAPVLHAVARAIAGFGA